MISIIAAIGKNNELGKNNALLWHLPADMKHFREITSGHTVIMGRKTFESIGRPLPDRKNIVITHDKNYLRPTDAKVLAGKHGLPAPDRAGGQAGVDIAHSLDEALKRARTPLAQLAGEIFVIGGAEIYRQAMEFADKLYITRIDAEDKEADSFFPEIEAGKWKEISREEREADAKNPFKYIFLTYERK